MDVSSDFAHKCFNQWHHEAATAWEPARWRQRDLSLRPAAQLTRRQPPVSKLPVGFVGSAAAGIRDQRNGSDGDFRFRGNHRCGNQFFHRNFYVGMSGHRQPIKTSAATIKNTITTGRTKLKSRSWQWVSTGRIGDTPDGASFRCDSLARFSASLMRLMRGCLLPVRGWRGPPSSS